MRRPNILVFMTDQEQAEVVEAGHPCQTPNAVRLAQDGLRFTRAFCPTAHCCPSRATFMTGLYPSRHGIYNNVSNPTAINKGMKPGVVTFSEALQGAGYNLALAGKWHVSDMEDPSDRGWEDLLVTSRKGSELRRSGPEWHDLPREPDTSEPRRPGQIMRPGWGHLQLYCSYPTGGVKGYEGLNDHRVIESALDALPRLAAQDAPWFLFVGPLGPHDPYEVPERFVRQYDLAAVPLPPSFADGLEDKPSIYRRLRQQVWGQLSDEEVRDAIRHYWAYCTLEDALFGEVLEALERTGQAEDTLVLRLSDHGDYAGAHGLFMKGVAPFRQAYQIVNLARWPNGIRRPGRAVDEFVTLADFAPTFLELAGAPAPGRLTGRSLAPFLRDQPPADWPDAFCTQFNGVELYYTQRCVTTREFKYVYNGFDFDELYDLREDPHEMVNLSDRPECQSIKRDLVRRMWRFAAREDDIIFNPYATVALAPWGPADALASDS